jgi:hypothetical protein
MVSCVVLSGSQCAKSVSKFLQDFEMEVVPMNML